MEKEYIKLPDIRGQKIRKKYYISSAIQHPAKANLPMMIWILKKFVKDGDVVLDPMVGIGTTLLEGMRLFPNSLFIGIELEEKFVEWCNASIKKVEKMAKEDWFMKVGKAVCVQGDSRELEKILREKVDKIVSSPPWGGQVQHKTNYLGKQKRESGFEYSEDPNNIGNLPHGNVDKIVTSPPFGQAQSGGGIAKKGYTGNKHSPTDLVGKRSYMPENVGEDKKNISNLPYVDKVITSPPYQKSISKSTSRMCREELNRKLWHSDYGDNEQNIGNLEQQTYLEAMLVVYQQCFKILKSEGIMILITKDFVRNKKRIRLGKDTIKLCEMTGFKYVETYHRKIKNPSFWRILYEQKYPSAEKDRL